MHYIRVADERELAEHLAGEGGAILCGGTDLLVKIRSGPTTPERLLDISDVESLRGVTEDDATVTIGAATTESDLLACTIIQDRLPLLATALAVLGSVQIRNRGTLGGNLVNASPAADSAIPLMLYDAELVLAARTGERLVPIEDFFVAPGETVLRPVEYVRAVRIPVPAFAYTPFFRKVGRRRALTISIASVGALLHADGDRVIVARFAAGSVASTPLRLHALEDHIREHGLSNGAIEASRSLAMNSISPIADVRATADYRRRVVGDLIVRYLEAFRVG